MAIDITPAQVHAMGHTAETVASTSLTTVRKKLNAADEDKGGAKLGGFESETWLGIFVSIWACKADRDVTNIDSVGGKLHSSANAAANGDGKGVDEFAYVPPVYPHGQGGRMAMI